MNQDLQLGRRHFCGKLAAAAAIASFLPGFRDADTSPQGRAAPEQCVMNHPPTGSAAFERAVLDLVIANHILANEGVMDAYGHVSVRHPEKPDHFLISVSRSPELVTPADIMEFHLDGTVVGDDPRHSYVERYIHGSIYRDRPDVMAVAHSHATAVLPFTVGSVPLRVVTHSAGVIGEHVARWDSHDKFGDTNLLVDSDAKGRDLAAHMGKDDVVLMRGHGFAAAGRDLIELIRICIYLTVDAEVLLEALRLGKVTPLTPGEIRAVKDIEPGRPELRRAWQYWAHRANCDNLL